MDKLTYKHNDEWCVSGINGKLISDKHANYWGEAIDRLAAYEDTDLTPEEFKESVDFILELNKKVHKVIEDLKYYLDTNEENGVVYIPKFVIEKIVNDN